MVLILGHATLVPEHGALCASALELLSARMGYRDRAQYLNFHLKVSIGVLGGDWGWGGASGGLDVYPSTI